MKHLSEGQLQELKRKLEEQLADLEDYTQNLEEEDPRQYADRVNDNAEIGDEALEDYSMMENEVLENAADNSIADIRLALAKMEDGTYGIDEKTGEPIAYERLKLFPAARENVRPEDESKTK
jgi:DnaK suppressor protein